MYVSLENSMTTKPFSALLGYASGWAKNIEDVFITIDIPANFYTLHVKFMHFAVYYAFIAFFYAFSGNFLIIWILVVQA